MDYWTLAVLVVAVFIASYFLDPIVRTRVENAMNQRLVGYHTRLNHAHVQLLSGYVDSHGLVVKQDSSSDSAVADLAEDGIQYSMARVVVLATWSPMFCSRIHTCISISSSCDAEKADPVPLSEKGWQDALEASTHSR